MSLISVYNTELSSFQLSNFFQNLFGGQSFSSWCFFVAVNDGMLGAEDKGGVLGGGGGQEETQRPQKQNNT